MISLTDALVGRDTTRAFPEMAISNLIELAARSAAISAFSVMIRVPFLRDLMPFNKLRRLIEIADLPDLKYGGIFPRSSYTPWKNDLPFRAIYDRVRDHTMVDEYRCHELWQLCEQIVKLEPGDILEVGAWRGGTGCLMAACRRDSRVFLCDTFSGVVKAGARDSAYVGGEHSDSSAETVLRLARQLNLENVRVLVGIFPEASAAEIAERRFRFCHIDVDVYESAADSFAWVWPRLVPGGIVVFDDYGFYSCGGITRLVDSMRTATDRLVLYNVNGHAIVIKQGGGVPTHVEQA